MNTFICENNIFLNKLKNILIYKNWIQLDYKIVYNYNETDVNPENI